MASPLNPYLSGDFTPDNAHNYNLLLSISEEDFSYIVTEHETLLAFGAFLPISQLSEPLRLQGAQHVTYKQVIAGVAPKDFAIIPNELFDTARANEFARYLNITDNDKIFTQQLNSDNHIIFNCSKHIEDRLTEHYPAVMINFMYKGWLQAIANMQPFNDHIYIDVQPGSVCVANFHDSKLRLYNRYTITDKNDMVYYVALVANELGLAQGDVVLSVSGEFEANDEYAASLKLYFRQVEISKLSALEHVPADIEPQQVLALSALLLCV